MRAHPPVYLFSVIVFFLFVPLSTFAATDVTDDITSDTEWTLGGSPYVVNFSNDQFFPRILMVAPDVTLTIDPGVVVKFGAYNGITVNGTLRALGTVNNPIIFTSLQDDSAGGDTNGDGALTTPTDEQWMHLEFSTGSIVTFDYTTVRYGGARSGFVVNTGIENYGGTLTVNHTTLMNNGFDGFGQYGGSTTITNSLISNQVVGINVYGGTLDVSGSSIRDNEVGIDNQSGVTVDARNNWWGDESGPYDEVNNAEGTGNGVSVDVAYTPWLMSDPLSQ
ncbi:MAG: hypothetical protein Q7R58_00095, partial [bacterium]|nr:hypothetical protein [bacterium]